MRGGGEKKPGLGWMTPKARELLTWSQLSLYVRLSAHGTKLIKDKGQQRSALLVPHLKRNLPCGFTR